jgi:protein-disulfide isomerase
LLLSLGLLAGAAGQAAAQKQEDGALLLARAAKSRALGHESARVLVYEFSDFQCPYCARFSAEVFPKLDSAYIRTGKVQWVVVNLPLPSHARAWTAAKAALCAGGLTGDFRTVRRALFQTQQEWSTAADPVAAITRHMRDAGVPMDGWEECVRLDRVAPLLIEDLLFAAGLRVSGTPSFLIHPEHQVVGIRSFAEWQALLDEMLRREERGH